MKVSKLKCQILLLSWAMKKVLICVNVSSILLVSKPIMEVLFLKMRSYNIKVNLNKNLGSRVSISKILVAYYTMSAITFATFPKNYEENLAQVFGSKFWHMPPWQTRYQNFIP